MLPHQKILDAADIRRYIAFMLNNQFDVNIHADNIKLDIDEFKSGFMPYHYEFNIGIELGSRIHINPISISISPDLAIITYVEKHTKGGCEYNEVKTLSSFIDAMMFSL